MEAIIVTGASAKEIASLVVALQGRQNADMLSKKEAVKLGPGMLIVLNVR